MGILCVAAASCTPAEPSPHRDASIALDAGQALDGGHEPDGGQTVCGDGQVDPGESCDDGNRLETDDCANDCTPTAPFRAYDEEINGVLARYDVPGATVAVTKDERLVLLRAYGEAHREQGRIMERRHRMRIASLSKPITAVAILVLVERGQLGLQDAAFDFLDDVSPPAGQESDPRLGEITIQHLLVHAGGWSRSTSGDPMFKINGKGTHFWLKAGEQSSQCRAVQ